MLGNKWKKLMLNREGQIIGGSLRTSDNLCMVWPPVSIVTSASSTINIHYKLVPWQGRAPWVGKSMSHVLGDLLKQGQGASSLYV